LSLSYRFDFFKKAIKQILFIAL